VYGYICETGLEPAVPALVLASVAVGVVSRTVGEGGSFEGKSLEEELAESVFFKAAIPLEEEGDP
jgi:hypothetical protein